MNYILSASQKAFVVVLPDNELVITPKYEKATQYLTIGDAMRAAVKVNQALGTHAVKAIGL